MAWQTFFDAFWPNLAATFVGIVVGLPFGLWLNRRIVREEEMRARIEELRRLQRALPVLAQAISENRNVLRDNLEKLSDEDTYPLSVGLDHVAWEACKLEVMPGMQDPEMQRRLALFFDGLRSLERLEGLLLEAAVGLMSVKKPVVLDALRQGLLVNAKRLLAEAESLGSALDKKLSTVLANEALNPPTLQQKPPAAPSKSP